MIKIGNPKDFFSGLMFIAFGTVGIVMAQAYPFGSAARMGPGYFPTLVCGLLIFLGALIMLRGIILLGPKVGKFQWRPLLWVLGSIVLFGFGFQSLGMVISIFILIVFSSLGGDDFKTREVLYLAIFLAAGSVMVFVYGLGLQIPIWPHSH